MINKQDQKQELKLVKQLYGAKRLRTEIAQQFYDGPCTLSFIQGVLEDPKVSVYAKKLALRSELITTEILTTVYKTTPYPELKSIIAGHTLLNKEVFYDILKPNASKLGINVKIIGAALNNPNCPQDLIDTWAMAGNYAAIGNPRLSKTTLDYLVGTDPTLAIHAKNCPPETLATVYRNSSVHHVNQQLVLRHPNCPQSLLDTVLANILDPSDDYFSLCGSALQNPQLATDFLHKVWQLGKYQRDILTNDNCPLFLRIETLLDPKLKAIRMYAITRNTTNRKLLLLGVFSDDQTTRQIAEENVSLDQTLYRILRKLRLS